MDKEFYQKIVNNTAAHIQAQLKTGALVKPDPTNPQHCRLMELVQVTVIEQGVQPDIYFAVSSGNTPEERHRNAQISLRGFEAYGLNNSVVIPLAADEFLSNEEILAILAHEFDHLKRPELLGEKTSEISRFERAYETYRREMHNGAPPELCSRMEEEILSIRSKVAGIVTEFEQCADRNAVEKGRGDELVSAITKVTTLCYLGDEVTSMPLPEAVKLCSDYEAHTRSQNPVSGVGHSDETFAERIDRLRVEAMAKSREPSSQR